MVSARWRVTVAAAAAMAMACAGLTATTSSAAASTPAASSASATAWGHDQNVPGVAALDPGDYAGIDSLSCSSAGNCSAVGFYTNSSQANEALVANEVNGTWQDVEPLPGVAALGTDSGFFSTPLSCSSAGNCSVGGSYAASGRWHMYIANEVNGTWQNAQRIPGMAALNTGPVGQTQVMSVSCPSDGDCAAAGYYRDSSDSRQAFVVNEVNGTWQNAEQVPGLTALGNETSSRVSSLTCPTAGNCSAVGTYVSSNSGVISGQGFTVDEVNGTWRDAQPVAGLAALNTGDNARLFALSCASAGNCSAAGNYIDSSSAVYGFTVDEVNGIWGSALSVPALGASARTEITLVSCVSPGNCGGAGSYTDSSGATQAFVAGEVNGTWHNAQELPGAADLPTQGPGNTPSPQITALSCPSAGNCTGIGVYTADAQLAAYAPFTIDEVNGTWGNAEPVPGLAVSIQPVTGMGSFATLSCPAAGTCTAGGAYSSSAGLQPVVVHEPVVSTTTALSLSRSALTYGGEQALHVSVAVSAASRGTPTGTVSVSGFGTTMCTVTLVSGAGSCALGAAQLPPGTYQITASYSGDADFGPSASPAQALTVSPGPDTVTLASPGAQRTTAGSPVDLRVRGTSSKGLVLSYRASGLPPGVSLSGEGLATGWPQQPGTYRVTVTATDSLNGTGSMSFPWTVSPAPGSGPAGYLRVQSGGKCLTDVSNRNGSPVDLQTCHPAGKAQRWTLAQDQTIRILGKCLTAPAHPGAQAQLGTCNGQASLRWELAQPRAVRRGAGAAPIALYNPASGLCLAEPGENRPNGTRVVMERCDGNTSQAWTPPPGPIASEAAGKCATDSNGKPSNGSKIISWACDGSARQRWQVNTDGTIRIYGKCLTSALNRRTPGSVIWLYTCWNGTNQQWRLIPSEGGTQIRNPASGLCLTDPRGSTENGTRLILGACTAAPPADNWRLR